MSPNKVHLFIAVPLPETIKLQLSDWCQHLQEKLSFKKWIFPADYHITVKFLGGVENDTLEKLKPLIKQIASEQSAFTLIVEGLNTFGKLGSPRILWTQVKGETNPLHLLQKNVDHSTESIGFIAENRPFTPHLTLAKNYMGKTTFESRNLDELANYQPSTLSWKANEIVLYQTHLGREPMYEPVEIFLFGR